MKQVLIKKGSVWPTEVPAPIVSSGGVMVKIVNSCISAGTEISGIKSSGRSLIQKTLHQPEQVQKALRMVRDKGIIATMGKITGKNEIGSPTGYSAAGIALAIGECVNDIRPADRVAVAGAGFANHAEYVDVPRNLLFRIPDHLSYRSASTIALGGIAMQGVRRAEIQFGEFVVVFGTGIIGQLTLQMLIVSGARVIAIDLDKRRLDIAREMGAELCLNVKEIDTVKAVHHYTNGHGVDVVVFCAATEDHEALSSAFAMVRKKGKVVMVGTWGRELKREDIYAKELDFLISTSYGPGRYDSNYEMRGLDYPYAYVRWTEGRNMEEYLRLLAQNKINMEPLIEASYPIEEAEKAYNSLQNRSQPLVVLLDYGNDLPKNFSSLVSQSRRTENYVSFRKRGDKPIRVGLIGAGSFATSIHLPNLHKLKEHFEVRAICSRTGASAQNVAQRFGAKYATSDYQEILVDPDIDLVMICTRHDLHGSIVLKSLEAGKNTFVEKPLCTTREDIEKIKAFYDARVGKEGKLSPLLSVGFNRRFSRYVREIKKHISGRMNPLFIHYRVNAGYIPLDHWVHSEEGGGRIIGEACHIVDLFSFLTESQIKAYGAANLRAKTGSFVSDDNKTISLEYEDGSVATLDYFSIGSKEFPKEYIEVHFDEKTIIVDDFKAIKAYGLELDDIRINGPNKGHLEELEVLAECLLDNGNQWPILLESLFETTKVTFELAKL